MNTIRLIASAGLFMMIGSGIIVYAIALDEEKILIAQAVEFASSYSELIKKGIGHRMPDRNHEAIQHTIENLAGSDTVRRITIYDDRGRVACSSGLKETIAGTAAGADACTACHAGYDRPLETSPAGKSWRIRKEDGMVRDLVFLDPVYNEPSCYSAACHFHSRDRLILGSVETEFPVSRIYGQLGARIRRRTLFPLLTLWLISPAACLLLRRHVGSRSLIYAKDATDVSDRPDVIPPMAGNQRDAWSGHLPGKAAHRHPGHSEGVAHMALESICDPFIILDRDYRIVKANEAYAQMRGIPVSCLMNSKCYEAIHGRRGRCDGCLVEKTFRSGGPCAEDRLVEAEGGGKAWLEIYTYPIRDRRGNVTHAAEYCRDVTDRKKTEKVIKQEYLELEQIFDTADATCVIDLNFRILRANSAFLTLAGRTREETVGRKCHEVFPGPECCSPDCHLTKMLRDPGRITHLESQRNLDHGEDAHFIITATAFRGPDGELMGIVEDFKDISSRKKTENELRSLSLHDELTGLCNRRGFLTLAGQELKRANRLKRDVFLLYSDLDGLKEINDTLGHGEGDRALQEVAAVLKVTFRTSDIIARIGGDEFVVIPVGTDGDSVSTAIGRLQKNIDICNRRLSRAYTISLSTGVACYDPECPCSINELLASGDASMYEEKRRRKDPGMAGEQRRSDS